MSQVVADSSVHKGDAPVVRSLVVMAETLRLTTMFKLMSKGATNLMTPKEERKQSDSDAPIVLVNDLSKGFGSEVEVTLRHDLRGKPTMGTRELEGREEERTKARDKIRIDRTRHAVKDGDKYAVQERGYALDRFSQSDLGRYFRKLSDQRLTYHLGGARGHDMQSDHIVPLEADIDFDEVMINPLNPPTANRHFFAGGADSISGGAQALTAADRFDRAELRRLKEYLEEMPHGIEPVDLSPDDDPYRYDPMYIMWVTPRMWTDFYADAAGKAFEQMQAAAQFKAEDSKMAVYRGECFLSDNILVRKMPYPVRFLPGRKVRVADPTRKKLTVVEQMVAANATFGVDRGLLVGGQALAMAFGNAAAGAKSGARNFDFETENRDFKAKKATAISWVDGCKKLTFAAADGTDTDRGVIAFDCAVSLKAGEV